MSTALPATTDQTSDQHSTVTEGAWRDRAVACFGRGDYHGAKKVLFEGLAQGTVSAGMLSDLGTVQFLLREVEPAEESLRQALQLSPGHCSAQRNLAELLLVTNRYDEARELFAEIVDRLSETERQRIEPHLRRAALEAAGSDIEPHLRWAALEAAANDGVAQKKHNDIIWEALGRVPGLKQEELQADRRAFARFTCADPWAVPPTYYEKKMQYYLSTVLLELNARDRFVDIASQGSPFPAYVSRAVGCEVFRQDLSYEPGRHDQKIGGNAAHMPVPDGFFTKITLHCSFEHFEDWNDRDFILEAARVLAPGGRMCIIPLYMDTKFNEPRIYNMTVGGQSLARDPGSQFSRVYDPANLAERVIAPAQDAFDVTVFRTTNLPEIRATLPATQLLYSHFVALFVRRGTSGGGNGNDKPDSGGRPGKAAEDSPAGLA